LSSVLVRKPQIDTFVLVIKCIIFYLTVKEKTSDPPKKGTIFKFCLTFNRGAKHLQVVSAEKVESNSKCQVGKEMTRHPRE
jgi:hypothetical protein